MSATPAQMWEARYGADANFVYGTEPNDFLRDSVSDFPPQVTCCALPTASLCSSELTGLRIDSGVETVRPVLEGLGHTGDGAVVQLIATKN